MQRFVICISMIFCWIGLSWSQTTQGTILGVVTDESGAVLPGAAVTATHTDTGLVRVTQADDQGRYRIPQLPLGNWSLKADRTGFTAATRSGVELTVGQEAVIDFRLLVGGVSAEVTVTGDAPLIETTTSEVGALVEQKTLRELPLNGRSFDQLATLESGVLSVPFVRKSENVGNATILSVSGGRTDTNTFVIDGTDIIDFGQTTPGSSAGTMLGVDGILEFKVLTHNFPAEYGRSGGAVINVITKSGTNDFHGTVFYFHRNSALDARNFFDLQSPPPFKRNQYGGSLGGRIKKDKTFFFLNYEGLIERLGSTLRAAVPNADAHRGVLPGLGSIGVNPKVAPYLALYPLPTGRDFGDGSGELTFGFSQPTDEKFWTARLDHRISDKNSIYARYSFDQADVTAPRPLPLFQEDRSSRTQSATMEETSILTNNQINSLRLGYSRSNPAVQPLSTTPIDPKLSFVPGVFVGVINFSVSSQAAAAVGGIAAFGPSSRAGGDPISNSYQVKDDYQATFGRHTIKSGVNISRYQFNQLLPLQAGTWNFADLASFLTDKPDTATGPGLGFNRAQGTRESLYGFYVQADSTLRRNLTLNLGLRYEYFPDATEVNGHFANLLRIQDAAATIGKWAPDAKHKTFQPRIGLAWQLKPTLVARAGFGVFHNQPIGRIFGNVIGSNVSSPVGSARTPTTFPDATSFTASTSKNAQRFAPDFKTPTMYHYHFDLQMEPLPRMLLKASYVGTHGSHLWVNAEANGPAPSILPDGRLFYTAGLPRQNPNFQTINNRESSGNSSYNGLLIELQRQFQGGFQFRTSYTYSKSIDVASAIAGADALNSPSQLQDGHLQSADRALSSYDARHRFVTNWIYAPTWKGSGVQGKLLSGWQLNGILTLSSGFPMTPLVGFNRSLNLGNADRPNLAPGHSNNSVLGGPIHYFDTSAYQLQPAGFLGSAGRNTVILSNVAAFDMSVSKRVTLRENTSLQIRAEMFNVLNHTNFGLPASGVFNTNGSIRGTAGQITDTTTSARQIQVGAKIVF